MKNQLRRACPPHIQHELEALFRQCPFQEMCSDYARQNNCVGITFDDASIYLLHQDSAKDLLMVYLHECAHALLIRAGHQRWSEHNGKFCTLWREREVRFEVSSRVWDHEYDQQDARVKMTMADTRLHAAHAANAQTYNPFARAERLADDANASMMREAWRLLSLASISLLLLIAWSKKNSNRPAIDPLINGQLAPLVGGVGAVATIYFFMRR